MGKSPSETLAKKDLLIMFKEKKHKLEKFVEYYENNLKKQIVSLEKRINELD